MDTDYKKLIDESFEKFMALFEQREGIDAELMKLRQFIYATINMLPDEERQAYNERLDNLANNSGGLTDAIKDILKYAVTGGRFVTVSQIRDYLQKLGFDFSGYSSNPLASVNTVIKRMKPNDVETTTIDGVTAYRWIHRFPRVRSAKAKAFFGIK